MNSSMNRVVISVLCSGWNPIDPACTSQHRDQSAAVVKQIPFLNFCPGLRSCTAISKQISQYGCKLHIMSMIMKGHESAFPILSGKADNRPPTDAKNFKQVGRTAVCCFNASASAVYHLHLLFSHVCSFCCEKVKWVFSAELIGAKQH